MKSLKRLVFVLLGFGLVISCGGGGDSQSDPSTISLSSREQAEIVAAALTTKEGGLGNDFENIALTGSMQTQGPAQGGLEVSAQKQFYDAQGARQEDFSADMTDRIQYTSHIKGDLTISACYFQEMNIDNQSNFTVDGLLSDMAFINGTHHLHASYARQSSINKTAVNFDLDCDLNVTGVSVKMNTIDVIPDTGVINGSIIGSYVRDGVYADVNHQLNFQFDVTYMGDNTAEIQLSGDTAFSVNLNTGSVVKINY